MIYDSYYWGMHSIWWLVWLLFLIWIFALPYDIPFQRSRRESPLEILRKRFAAGQVTKEEYHDRKKILEADMAKR
jgi:putative membrane protein